MESRYVPHEGPVTNLTTDLGELNSLPHKAVSWVSKVTGEILNLPLSEIVICPRFSPVSALATESGISPSYEDVRFLVIRLDIASNTDIEKGFKNAQPGEEAKRPPLRVW